MSGPTMPHGDTLTISNRQLLGLHRGLSSLDAIREGKDELISFAFSREVSWRLTVAAVAVEAAKLAFDRGDRELCKRLGVHDGMTANAENADKLAEYAHELEELRDQVVTVHDVGRFTLSELLDRPVTDDKRARKTNPISQSTLKNLAPILDEK